MNCKSPLLLFSSVFIFPLCLSLALADVSGNVRAADPIEASQKATDDAAESTFLLRYKFNAGERLRWKVSHLVTVKTKIQGTNQKAEMRSYSTKAWQVTSVNPDGEATFSHVVENIDMWQKVSGRKEVHYNSTQDNKPPPEYDNAAQSVGVPLATITLKPTGEIIERADNDRHKKDGFGGGQVTIPLAEQPVKIGDKWSVPYMIPVRNNEGTQINIKSQQVFSLEKVVAGLATVSVRTELLTPIKDPRIQAQLVQRLLNGMVKFDINDGRVIRQRMDLDELVLAFNGADSSMNYRARFTEELLGSETDPSISSEATKVPVDSPSKTTRRDVKPRRGKSTFRR